MKHLLALTLSLILGLNVAHARTWQINLIQSYGPREIGRQDAIAMMAFARGKLAEVGVKTRLGRASFSKLLNPQYNLDNYWAGAFWWQRHLPGRTNIIRHVITPPFFTNGSWYIAGVTPGICIIHSRYAMTTSNAQLFNGADRWYHSAIAMAHEEGHVFGSKHVVGDNIMNPDALSLDNLPFLQFAPQSVTQIYQCLRG